MIKNSLIPYLRAAMIVHLWNKVTEHGEDLDFSIDDLADPYELLQNGLVSLDDIESTIDVLVREGYISEFRDDIAETFYIFSEVQQERIWQEIKDPNSLAFRCRRFGSRWVNSAFQRAAASPQERTASQGDMAEPSIGGDHQATNSLEPSLEIEAIPAADRTVALDHNSRGYADAVSAYDALIDQVRGDNAFGEQEPEEKEQLTKVLIAGRSLLNQTKVKVSTIEALVMPPLRYVARKWVDAAIGASAAVVVGLIAKLLGLF